MALPSQSGRSSTFGHAYTRPRKLKINPIVPAVVVIAAVAIIGTVLWPRSPKKDGASRIQTPPAEPLLVQERPASDQEHPAEKKPPVEVQMGRSDGPSPSDALAATAENPAPIVNNSKVAPPETHVDAGPAELAGAPETVRSLVKAATDKLATDPVVARELLNRALTSPDTPEPAREYLRTRLAALNEDLVFSPRIVAADPLVSTYTIQSGDALVKIAARESPGVDWRLIPRVNRISDPNKIRLNQKLKIVKGPFHAVVHKAAYRMDIYAGAPDDPGAWIYIRSFSVGLGEGDSTPVAQFIVRRGSKLVNPYWTNPRTGERFDANDPKNPIGEHWIGLEGQGESAAVSGYGVHGTIDPESIGQQRSMGCIRMRGEDVALVYELLGEGVSRVEIRP